jgi:hypothetical protein
MTDIDDTCPICGEIVDIELCHFIDRGTGRVIHWECKKKLKEAQE